MLKYPASGADSVELNAAQWVFTGQHALRGIALKLLTEACRMHPALGTYLISVATCPEKADLAFVQMLDVLLTKVVRLQGLLPGGIATKGSKFVLDIGKPPEKFVLDLGKPPERCQ